MSGGYDRTIKLWDLLAREVPKREGGGGVFPRKGHVLPPRLLCTGIGHSDCVSSVASTEESPPRIVSASHDRSLRLWEIYEESSSGTASALTGAAATRAPPSSFSPSSSAGAAEKGGGKSYSLRCMAVLMGHTEAVSCCAMLPMGRLVSGGLDGTLFFWGLPLERELRVGALGGAAQRAPLPILRPNSAIHPQAADYTIWSLAKLGGGSVLAVGGGDGVIKLWNHGTGVCEMQLNLQQQQQAVPALAPPPPAAANAADAQPPAGAVALLGGGAAHEAAAEVPQVSVLGSKETAEQSDAGAEPESSQEGGGDGKRAEKRPAKRSAVLPAQKRLKASTGSRTDSMAPSTSSSSSSSSSALSAAATAAAAPGTVALPPTPRPAPPPPKPQVLCLAVSRNGSLVSGGSDGVLRVHNPVTGALLAHSARDPHAESIYAVAAVHPLEQTMLFSCSPFSCRSFQLPLL